MTNEAQRTNGGENSTFDMGRSTWVDTHCHLDWKAFDADRDAIIRRAIDAGVTRMVTIGVDVPSSRRALELAETYPGVYAGIGIHPNDAGEFDTDALAELRAMAIRPKAVAIGEIGLDSYWKKVAPETQAAAFCAQIELAIDLGKPVIIHSRDSIADVLAVLERYATRITQHGGVLHSFSGTLAEAQHALALGLLIGVAGPVTYEKADALRGVVQSVPLDRLIVETDAPFLPPVPHRGQRNEPAHVRHVADQIARLRHLPVETIAEQTTANAARLFRWTPE